MPGTATIRIEQNTVDIERKREHPASLAEPLRLPTEHIPNPGEGRQLRITTRDRRRMVGNNPWRRTIPDVQPRRCPA